MLHQTKFKAFFGSLLAHALLLIILFVVFHEKDFTSRPVPPIFIEITEPVTRRSLFSPKTITKINPSHSAGISLKNLGIGSSSKSAQRHSEAEGSSPSQAKIDSDGFAQSMSLQEEAKALPFFKKIWERIDAKTGYPNDFVQERIHGSVTLQFRVNRDGTLAEGPIEASSDDEYLKAYVLAITVHALSQPISKNAWLEKGLIPLRAQFQFSTFGVGHTNLSRERQWTFKNQLQFERQAYVDPKLNQMIDKFFRKYMPPVIPIPGGVYIDFYRVYEMVHSMGKQDPEDLRPERLEFSKKAWETIYNQH